MDIKPRFCVGQKVWLASPSKVTKRHPCPDCMGLRKWGAVSPVGEEYSFPCPRCSSSYFGDRELSLNYDWYIADVQPLTIGSVRYNSDEEIEDQYTYMCRETGVGSGRVYRENTLCETEEEARAVSEKMAEKNNKDVPTILSRYNRTLRLSDFTLTGIRDASSNRG